MRDLVAHLESQFSRLVIIGSTFEEEFKVGFFLASESHHQKFAPIVASIKMLKEEMATWDNVTNIIIEKNRTLKNTATNTRANLRNEKGYLTSAVGKPSRRRPQEAHIVHVPPLDALSVTDWDTWQEIVDAKARTGSPGMLIEKTGTSSKIGELARTTMNIS